MYRSVVTCKECVHYKLKDYGIPHVSECIYWGNRNVKESDYCSRGINAYTCRFCKYCKPLSGDKGKYVCVQGDEAVYVILNYSCQYFEHDDNDKVWRDEE